MRVFDIKLSGRKVVAYGAGGALLGLGASGKFHFDYVVDDTPGFAGQSIDGLGIHSSERLFKDEPKPFVIICAHVPPTVAAIAARLERGGLRYGDDYVDCSLLQYESMSARLKQLGVDPSYERFALGRVVCLNSPMRNLSTIAGTWLFSGLVERMDGTDGAVAECGVYQGGNAYASLLTCKSLRERDYLLLDSFAGLPDLSGPDPAARSGEFANVDLTALKRLFKNFDKVHIHQGLFNATFPTLKNRQYIMAYVDCYLYEPTLQCCAYYWPKIAPGGCMLFHDYWLPTVDLPKGAPPVFRGVNQAVNEFFSPQGAQIVEFPETSHAVVVKR